MTQTITKGLFCHVLGASKPEVNFGKRNLEGVSFSFLFSNFKLHLIVILQNWRLSDYVSGSMFLLLQAPKNSYLKL